MYKNRTRSTVLVAALLAAGLFLGGCDFNKVGSGSDSSLETVLAVLSTADTQERAVVAINALLDKTEIGNPDKPGPYQTFRLYPHDVEAYADMLVEYNSGRLTPASTYGSIIALLRKSSGMKSAPAEILSTFGDFIDGALQNPESPYNAVVLAAASKGTALPAKGYVPTAIEPLSPVRDFLFVAWLTRNSNGMDQYVASKNGAPERITICHYYGVNNSKAKELTVSSSNLGTLPGHYGHGDFLGECTTQSCSAFCYGFRQDLCLEACYATCDPLDVDCTNDCNAFCKDQAYQCDLQCHEQGLAGIIDCSDNFGYCAGSINP